MNKQPLRTILKHRKRTTVSAWSLRFLQLDAQQFVIDEESVHPVNGFFGGDWRIVTDKSEALTKSASLVNKYLRVVCLSLGLPSH